MAQGLGALDVSKDQGWIPSMHMEAPHLLWHKIRVVHKHTCRQTLIYITYACSDGGDDDDKIIRQG